MGMAMTLGVGTTTLAQDPALRAFQLEVLASQPHYKLDLSTAASPVTPEVWKASCEILDRANQELRALGWMTTATYREGGKPE
jgi:hypothetical protein